MEAARCEIDYTSSRSRGVVSMSARSSGDRPDAVAVVDDPTQIRNIALVGPSGAGKTTLAEALLAVRGDRAGRIGGRRHHRL